MADAEELIEEENAKRKELSRVRVFWLLLALCVVIAAIIAIQFVILFTSK